MTPPSQHKKQCVTRFCSAVVGLLLLELLTCTKPLCSSAASSASGDGNTYVSGPRAGFK